MQIRFEFSIVIVFLVLLASNTAHAVVIDGKDWRQVTETTSLSYNQLDEIYSTETGRLDTGISSVGGVEFDGWIWASAAEVANMLNEYVGTTIGTMYQEKNSTWAPSFFAMFTATATTAESRLITGRARADGATLGARAQVIDRRNTIVSDMVSIYPLYTYAYDSQYPAIGHWLYRDIPEPATLGLIGLGLAGIGFARKKKQN